MYFGQVTLAVASSFLTIYLTDSTTFTTRKESGVLAPDFSKSDDNSNDQTTQTVPKRKVMYYVSTPWILAIRYSLTSSPGCWKWDSRNQNNSFW